MRLVVEGDKEAAIRERLLSKDADKCSRVRDCFAHASKVSLMGKFSAP
jgi:hypothetical protein